MKDKKENLKFIISRIDNYIESSQNKSNLLLALNTIILGGVITLVSCGIKICSMTLLATLGVIAILATVSILITINSIIPYLKGAENKSNSIVFFCDIKNMDQKEYLEKINTISEEDFINDLSGQTHSLAKGLNGKYKLLTVNSWIIGAEFILLLIWFLIFLTTKN